MPATLPRLHLNNVIVPGFQLCAEAQMVVAMRLAGMMGLWPVGEGETHRMIAEKGPALMSAAVGARDAALAGLRPDQIILAAITPLAGAARDNRLRLSAPPA